ncbi:hypothetical protein ABPG72_022769 [Tetrahymena utriculariae]
MKQSNFLLIIFFVSIILALGYAQNSPGNNQPGGKNPQPQPPPDQGQKHQNPQNNRCNANACLICLNIDGPDDLCLVCRKGYDFQRSTFSCLKREEFEDRGDGFSLAFGIINIIFLIVLYFGWMIISRKNMQRFINLQQTQQANQQGVKLQDNEFEAQIIKIGAPSEFDTRSKKSSTVEPVQFDEKDMKLKFSQKSPAQNPVFDVEKQSNNNSSNENNNFAVGYPVNLQQSDFVPEFKPQTQQQQQQNSARLFITSDLNGYWLTQAGRFSFQNFSNFHRIKHIVINVLILQRIFSSMFNWALGRGNDDDSSLQKQLLFVGFLVCIVIYWFASFIPPIIIKIFSYCMCLKSDPNGRCSSIFINVLFYVASIIMITLTSDVIFRMTGFEAQVFLLVCISAWLITFFFDKKSIEFAKRRRGGFMEKLIKFRKIDFSSGEQNQPPIV